MEPKFHKMLEHVSMWILCIVEARGFSQTSQLMIAIVDTILIGPYNILTFMFDNCSTNLFS
jgi:hypothetical protein